MLIARILMLLGAAANYAVQVLYYVHMLQLNSYRPERYRKWCADNESQIVKWTRLLPALMIALMWFKEPVALWGSVGVLWLSAVLNIPKPAKKKLVFTPRVKRLFVTLALWAVLVLGGIGVLYPYIGCLRAVGIVCLFSLVPWFFVGVANRIHQPLEKRIGQKFTDEAVSILRSCPDLTVVGITGSYGKTSTKSFLQALLSARYQTLMTPESFNTPMGVVRTVREQLRPSHEVFLAEMGAKQTGDIREICDIVHPKYGIITSLGEQHLETFHTVDNIVRTKFELADALPADGCLFANLDNDLIRAHLAERGDLRRCVTYGTTAEDADYRGSEVSVGRDGSTFTVTAPSGEAVRFTTKLFGLHNIQNLVGCIAVANTLGIPMKELVYPVRLLKPVQHRLQLLPNGFIDDAYNSNPAGFRSALDVLSGFPCRRVLVTPGCVELGEREHEINRELGAYAATRCDDIVLVGKKQAPPLREGALSAGFDESRLFVADDLKQALSYVAGLPADRIVLLENDLPDNF